MRLSRSLFCFLAGAALLSACGGGGGGSSSTGVTYDNSKLNGDYTYVAMGNYGGVGVEVGTITFDGSGNGVYTAVTTTVSGTMTYTVTTDNAVTIKDPVYGTSMVGTLRSGGSFFVGVDTTKDNETMIVAVKKSKLMTDVTATYYSGQFSYDGQSRASIVGIRTATPSPGELAWADLYSTASGTFPYAFDADGTLSMPTGTASLFGAVTEDHQLMVLGDGETVLSPEVLTMCGFKLPGSGMTNASLNGTYMLYQFRDDNVALGSFVTNRGTLVFNGIGSATYTELASSTGTLDPGGIYTYVVLPDGSFGVQGALPGVVIQDGSVFGIIDYDATDMEVSVMIGVKQ